MELVLKVPGLKPVEDLGTVMVTSRQIEESDVAERLEAGVVDDAGAVVAVAAAAALVAEEVAVEVAEDEALVGTLDAHRPAMLLTMELPSRRTLRKRRRLTDAVK